MKKPNIVFEREAVNQFIKAFETQTQTPRMQKAFRNLMMHGWIEK